MDSIIKKLFSGFRSEKNTAVPEEFSWDNMKAGIFEKMAEDDEPMGLVGNSTGRNKWMRRSLVLLLLLLGSIYALKDNLFNRENNYTETAEKSEELQRTKRPLKLNARVDAHSSTQKDQNYLANNKLQDQKSKSITGKKLNTEIQEKEKVTYRAKSSLIEDNSNVNSSKLKKKDTSTKTILEIDQNSEISSSKKLNPIYTQTELADDFKDKNSDNKSEKITELNTINFEQKGLEKTKLPNLQLLDNKVILPVRSKSEIKLNAINLIESHLSGFKDPTVSSWSLGFIAGAGMLSGSIPIKYNSATSPFYVKETPLISPFVKIYAKKEMRNNFYASVGLEYQKNRRYMEYRRDSLMKLALKDTILAVVQNLISGEITYERGDTVVDALFSHNVKHLNVENMIQIPVLIGYNFKSNDFKVGISVGANINVYTQHTGKTYNHNSEIIDINLNDEFMIKNVGVSLLANMNLGYRISPHYSIVMEAGFQKYLKNWRKETYAKEWKPSQYRLGLGVEYRF